MMHTNANIRVKLLTILSLLMLVGGNLWADSTYKLSLNGSATESNGGAYGSLTFFSVTGNFNSKYKDATYDGISFTSGLKLESSTGTVSFTSSSATVTIVQSTSENAEKTIKMDGIELPTSTASPVTVTTGTNYREYVITGVAAGSHTISRGSGEGGLLFVQVVQSGDKITPTSSFAYGSSCLAVIPVGGSSTTVNNTFTTNSDGAVTYSISDNTTSGTTPTVDASGNVTVYGTGTLTVHASVAATSTYAAQELTYTLTVNRAGQETINVSDLKVMIPYGGVNANRNINRTIPRFDFTFGGGDGVKFNTTGEFLFRQSGTVEVALRKAEGGDYAAMTSIAVTGNYSTFDMDSHTIDYYIQASSGTLSLNAEKTVLTWTGNDDDVTLTSQNRGVSVTMSQFVITHNGYPLNTSKVTPTFSFSPSSQGALVSSSEEYATTYTSSPGYFDAVAFADGCSTGTAVKANNPVAGGSGSSGPTYTLVSGTTQEGTATLTASFAGNDFFNAATTATYTLTVGAALSSLTSFAFNRDDVLYQGAAGNIYINNTHYNTTSSDPFEFAFDPNRSTIKTKINLDPSLSTIGASATSTYFVVETSDATVLDVSSVGITSASNGTRLYFDGIRVLKAGTAILTYRFLGSETYAATNCTVTVNVKPALTTYSGSYPFTWDFTSATSWDGSKLQLGYYAYRDTWTYHGSWHSFQSKTASIAANNGIDKIQGLAFSGLAADGDNYLLFLDPGEGATPTPQLALHGNIIVPDLSPDYQVTITGATGNTISVGGNALTESSGTWTYTPTTTGDVTFAVSDVGKAIYTIAVTRAAYTGEYTYQTSTDLTEGTLEDGKYLIDGKERKLKGIYSFTGDGSFTSGTTISEVPGISATITKGSSELNVASVSVSGRYNGHVLMGTNNSDTGATITFTPYVNGFLSLQGNFYQGTKINNGTSDIWTCSGNTYWQNMTEISVPLIAGTTYTLSGGNYAWELHAFAFTPAFLLDDGSGNPGTTVASKNSASPLAVNKGMASDKYPHLITSAAGEGKVKFAGDKNVVYLYSNNHVDLLGSGETIIKGTVLLEGSDEELFTYYYLQSTILELEKIGKQPTDDTNYADTTAIVNQDYIDIDDLQNGSLVFRFNHPIARAFDIDEASSGVKFRILGGNSTGQFGTWTNINNGAWTSIEDGSNNNFRIKVGDLEEGKTYQFIIEENVLKKSDDAGVMNSEVFLMFTVNKDLEVPIKLIYPSGVASLGTSIVLETNLKDDSNKQVYLDNTHKVVARLAKEDGTGTTMYLNALFNENRLIFKPTSSLESNTRYVLWIYPDEPENDHVTGGQVWMKSATIGGSTQVYKITTLKAFYFMTGTSAGTNPQATDYSPANDPNGNVPVTDYESGRISITFDQSIEIEPYSTVYATPVNGSESTATGYKSMNDSESATTMHVTSDGKTLYFDYGADALKYDLYYEVRIPVNTVTGTGGKPNDEEIKFRFRMAKNPSATAVESATFYPHTWDFNKFGDTATAGTTAYNITNGKGDPGAGYRVNSLYESTDGGYKYYATKSQAGYGYDQGADVYFHYKLSGGSATKEVMDEFEGIRISLVSARSNRFEIRNLTSGNSEDKNSDGTDKWSFRMIGNTHYMTLSNVPAGKLYLVVNTPYLGINSPNAVFESVSGSGYTLSNENTLLNTNGTKYVAINVETAGDVVFCVKNLNLEKIGVPTATKTFKPSYVVSEKTYATDRLGYDVRYDLPETFTGTGVKAYYVSGVTNNEENTTATITATEVSQVNAVRADQGVLVLYQGAVAANTDVPVFKTDVNTTSLDASESGSGETLTNKLKVIAANATAFPAADEGYYNYVLSSGGNKGGGVGFYRYTGTTFSPRAAYLPIRKEYVEGSGASGSGAKTISLVFIDDDGVTTRIENVNVNPNANGNQAVYDLTGRKVADNYQSAIGNSTLPKGIYIVNGKKIVIK